MTQTQKNTAIKRCLVEEYSHYLDRDPKVVKAETSHEGFSMVDVIDAQAGGWRRCLE